MKNLHGIAREIAIDNLLAIEELKDYMVRSYGFENESTIEFFMMCERHESLNILRAFVKLVDATAMEEEEFGFEM